MKLFRSRVPQTVESFVLAAHSEAYSVPSMFDLSLYKTHLDLLNVLCNYDKMTSETLRCIGYVSAALQQLANKVE